MELRGVLLRVPDDERRQQRRVAGTAQKGVPVTTPARGCFGCDFLVSAGLEIDAQQQLPQRVLIEDGPAAAQGAGDVGELDRDRLLAGEVLFGMQYLLSRDR